MKRLWLLLIACLVFAVMLAPVSGEVKSTKCEIFSWWTVGGEATGLKALFEEYNKANPKVEIINAAIGSGAGNIAKAVLVSRMMGGDPPDAFQVHGGQELLNTWVSVGKMAPATSLYKSEGWEKVFPKGIRDLVKYKGGYWAVPVGIHRCNVLWYNKKVFEKYNRKVPVTMNDFFKAADAFKADGIMPLVLGAKSGYEVGMTFETVLMGTLGPAKYLGLWNGKT